MKNNKLIGINTIAVIIMILITISCKTTPEPERIINFTLYSKEKGVKRFYYVDTLHLTSNYIIIRSIKSKQDYLVPKKLLEHNKLKEKEILNNRECFIYSNYFLDLYLPSYFVFPAMLNVMSRGDLDNLSPEQIFEEVTKYEYSEKWRPHYSLVPIDGNSHFNEIVYDNGSISYYRICLITGDLFNILTPNIKNTWDCYIKPIKFPNPHSFYLMALPAFQH